MEKGERRNCQKQKVALCPSLVGICKRKLAPRNSQLELLKHSVFHCIEMVLLVTSDNEQFHADKEVVERSVLIKNMLEGNARFTAFQQKRLIPTVDVGESDQPIPLPNVSSSVLKKAGISVVISLCAVPFAPLLLICSRLYRFSSTANTTVESLCQVLTQTRIRTKLVNEQRTFRNGTKGLSPWTRRCCSRLSSPPTTLI